MSNGSNEWGVPYSDVVWLANALRSHNNVSDFSRDRDILFTIDREKQKDQLRVLLLREYTMSLTLIQRAQNEFDNLDIIYIGGGWCGYTHQAKEYAVESKLGLFVTDEFLGALWKDAYWTHYKRNNEGNPRYFYKAG